MAILKCKMCGGNLEVTDGIKVVECDYCGTKQTVPSMDNERKLNLFNRATKLRMACEFDAAAAVYENIVADFPDEAEAYWGLCLCSYGIEYVDDPATAKKIPTCHRASFTSLQSDENFQLVLNKADVIAKEMYIKEAKDIDSIMDRILAVSKNEKPYDVFICYKETDEKGERTEDSVLAEELYNAISAKGFKVFFSKITLDKKLGVEYEPYIFAALNSAKVMLAVGTKPEYFEAVWVKNEWSRFIRIAAKDKSKIIIPCYKGIDPAYDLPEAFRRLQAHDLSKLGVIQDLARGIEKLLGEKEARSPVFADSGSKAEALLKRTFLSIEYGEWKTAEKSCDEALNADAENARAYLASLLITLKVKSLKELENHWCSLERYSEYAKILRFGDEQLKAEITAINDSITKRVAAAEKEKAYALAKEKMGKARKYEEFYELAIAFNSFEGYKESDELKMQCAEKFQKLRKSEIELAERMILSLEENYKAELEKKKKIQADIERYNKSRDNAGSKGSSLFFKMLGLAVLWFVLLVVVLAIALYIPGVDFEAAQTWVAIVFMGLAVAGIWIYKAKSHSYDFDVSFAKEKLKTLPDEAKNSEAQIMSTEKALNNWCNTLARANTTNLPF